MNHSIIRLRHLFAGADEGHYTLPAEVAKARVAVAILRRAIVPVRVGNEEQVALELLEAAGTGELPDGWQTKLRPHIIEAQHHDAASAALNAARDRADDRLLSVTLGAGDTILTDHLRPKLQEAIELVQPHAEQAIDLPWGVPTKLFAPEYVPIIDALGKGAAIYAAIRRGQSILRETCGVPDNEANLHFGELRSGVRAHWPTFRTQGQTLPPWGNHEGPARFAWLVANLVDDLWMPTPEECDGAYRALVRTSGLRPAPVS